MLSETEWGLLPPPGRPDRKRPDRRPEDASSRAGNPSLADSRAPAMKGTGVPRGRSDPAVDAIVEALSPEQAAIARELRQTIRATAPRLEECVKWNSPHWKGRSLVLNLMVYPDHLNLGLWRGAELAKSFPEIEGTGKSLRHVRIHDVAQAKTPQMRKLIRAAVTLDRR
jgi:hypothetical protein